MSWRKESWSRCSLLSIGDRVREKGDHSKFPATELDMTLGWGWVESQ